jgi:TolB-like protein
VTHAVLLALLLAAQDRPKLVVLDLTPAGGVEPAVTGALTEALTNEVAAKKLFEVVSSKDINTLMGVERQKAMMGCSEDQSACLAELSGALGAKFVMSGTVAKLGDAYQLTLQTLDSGKAQPIGRSTKIAPDLAALQYTLPYAVAEATGTPMPAPPSRLLPYSLMGVGGGAIVVGGIFGLGAITREGELNGELSSGVAGTLARLSDYQARADAARRDKTISLAVMAVGVGLVASGLYLNPRSDAGGVAVALVPQRRGLSLVGVLP